MLDDKLQTFLDKDSKGFYSKNQNIAALLVDREGDNLGIVSKYSQLIVWKDNFWKTLDKPTKYFYSFFSQNQYRNWTLSTIEDVILHMEYLVKNTVPDFSTPYITLNDFCLNTEFFTLEPIDKKLFSFLKVDLDSADLKDIENWKLEDTNSRFAQFIKEIMVDDEGNHDPELTLLLQEGCGYCFYPNVSAEASFFFKGEGANGKGVIMYLLEQIIGEEFVTATNIETLTKDKWAAAELIGKKLNICSENESDMVNSAKFKACVSGDPIRIEKKFKDSFKAPLNVKFIFSTNDFPKFSNFDKALIRRIHIIPFNLELEESKKDGNLRYKMLKEERKIITMWFLQGLFRLIKNKMHFTVAEQSLKHLKIETENNLPSLEYFSENIEITKNEDHIIELSVLYKNYEDWCLSNRRKPVGSKRFGKELKQNLKLDTSYKWVDGKSAKCYQGIRFSTSIRQIL